MVRVGKLLFYFFSNVKVPKELRFWDFRIVKDNEGFILNVELYYFSLGIDYDR